MRFSGVLALGLAVIGTSISAGRAVALDVQHTVHHAKTTSKHLAVRHTTPHSIASSHRVHATAASSASFHHAVLTSRHHHYYGERFTASSFAKGDIFAGDITTGEDPVVRQAAIDALGDMNGTAVV
ncbi:MAG: penicillin-binding protein, partial [Terracidiphilus sp.]